MAVGKAAQKFGTMFGLSSLGTFSIEDIAKEINYLIMLNKDLKNISEKELIQYATKSIIKEVSLNIIEIELENINDLVLNDYEYSIEKKMLKIESKEVNKDIIEIITQIEQTTKIKNINIINSSLEDAFIKLTK